MHTYIHTYIHAQGLFGTGMLLPSLSDPNPKKAAHTVKAQQHKSAQKSILKHKVHADSAVKSVKAGHLTGGPLLSVKTEVMKDLDEVSLCVCVCV